MSAENKHLIVAIIESVANGNSLTSALQCLDLSGSVFRNALKADPTLQARYDEACSFRAELQAGEIIDIADGGLDPIRDKLRIDARKWVASKMNPQKFGERIEHNHTGSVDLIAAMDQGRQRIKDIEVLDTTELLPNKQPDGLSGSRQIESTKAPARKGPPS
jgi:hypothetical protein